MATSRPAARSQKTQSTLSRLWRGIKDYAILVGLGLVTLSMLSSYYSFPLNTETEWRRQQSQQILSHLEAVVTESANAEHVQREYVLSGNEESLKALEHVPVKLLAHVSQLKSLTERDATHATNLSAIEQIVHKRLKTIEEFISVCRSGNMLEAAQALRSGVGRSLTKDLRKAVDASVAHEKRFVSEREARVQERMKTSNILSAISSFLALILLAATTFKMRRDLTHRQAVEAELEKARREAETASQLKSAFLASVSHEIRTPLNGIMGLTQVLLKGGLEASEERTHLEIILESGEKLLLLINGLLDMSKIESGKLEINPEPFRPRKLVQGTTNLLASQAQQKGIVISAHVSASVPDTVLGDTLRIQQVLTNLLSNAIKFTPKGDISIWVDDEGSGAETKLLFRVVDSGPGISEEFRKRMFQPFSQEDFSTTRRYGGTGLGLFICRQLVHEMGGEIGVKSKLGEGSEFWFRLPLPLVEATAAPKADKIDEERPSLGLRVLVAEDNPVNQKVISALLANLGCVAKCVDNGIQALEALASWKFDAVLMDCHMPEMDGYETSRRIRRLKTPAKDIPIIAVTASAMEEERERCLSSGMDDYITKPIALEELRAALLKNGAIKAKPTAAVIEIFASKAIDDILALEAPGLLAELVEIFAQQTQAARREFPELARHKDWPAIAELAHRLRSSCGQLGLYRLRASLEKLEKHPEAGDLADYMRNHITEFIKELEIAEAVVEAQVRPIAAKDRSSAA